MYLRHMPSIRGSHEAAALVHFYSHFMCCHSVMLFHSIMYASIVMQGNVAKVLACINQKGTKKATTVYP